MAKKDIITDFGTLREMISFSEKPAESSQDNNFLKTGQTVVLITGKAGEKRRYRHRPNSGVSAIH